MKQSLQLRIGTQLAMTPQLQQAIRLLQLSTLELQAEVQETLDSNYMLEAAEEESANAEADGPSEASDVADANDVSTEDVLVAESTGSAPDETPSEPDDIPSELPVDSAWDDIYDGPPTAAATNADSAGYEFDNHGSSDETLRDHLIWQMEMTYFSDTDRVIASSIIDSIRDDGYLSSPVEEIWESLHTPDNGLELDEVEAVLRQIQNFDPPGVAARDLSDCLSIQLRQLPTDTPWLAKALELVGDYLNVWAGRDYNALQKRLHLDRDELQAVVDLVHTLNPRPGSQIDSSPPEYIIPDVIVTQRKGAWHVELNPDAMPRVRINASYASLVRRGDDSAANESMRKHLNEARWFIKSLKSRSETLLKVSTCIVERQQGFLEHGDEAMKPMVLHDIAEAVSMHESTISRVTTRKYMHTPRGIFELKYFFSSQVATDSGGGASSTAIRAIIKKLIADENPGKPLSDSKLATKLSEHGIKVARRTIAKYRESMAIPSSSERKQLV